MEQTPVKRSTALQHKAISLKNGIRINQPGGRQPGSDPEEAVHEPEDGGSAPAAGTVSGLGKIRDQPLPPRAEPRSTLAGEMPELVRAKAIEKKVGSKEIKGFNRAGPKKDIRVHP
jgi:hypothetical protein